MASIKRVLAPLDGHAHDEAVLNAAILVQRRFGGQVEGLFIHADPVDILPYIGDGMTGRALDELFDAARAAAKGTADTLCAQVAAAANKAGLAMLDPDAKGKPGIVFTVQAGQPWRVVSRQSRLADLTVFSRAAEGKRAGGDTLEGALMMAGRPVMIVPHDAVAQIGETVMIAWDGSHAAAHAVSAALPFLEQASSVEIRMIAASGDPMGASSADLHNYLALHGVTASEKCVDPGGRAVADVLLDEAGSADLLVMGGYNHSRLREIILGGVTRSILMEARMPVMLAH